MTTVFPIDHFRVPKTHFQKNYEARCQTFLVKMVNHLHEINKSFSCQGLCPWCRFEIEDEGNSEMAHSTCRCHHKMILTCTCSKSARRDKIDATFPKYLMLMPLKRT